MGKLSAKEIVKDIRLGLSDSKLTKKYNISNGALKNIFNKLIDAGIITSEELKNRSMPCKCPSCGFSSIDTFEECPKCGVVLAKFNSQQDSIEPIPSDDSNKDNKRSQIEEPISKEDRKYKECPYCGEQILKAAKKCKHCGEFLEGPSNGDETKDVGDEKSWEGKPANITYLFKYIIGILLIVAYGIGLIIIVWAILDRRFTKYSVTKRRISSQKGILSRKVSEIEIKDIRSINYSQGILERLFGFGTITIATAGTAGVEIVFKGINNPKEVQNIINQLKDKVGR